MCTAATAASQKARRSRALPRLESCSLPRWVPDWVLAKSKPHPHKRPPRAHPQAGPVARTRPLYAEGDLRRAVAVRAPTPEVRDPLQEGGTRRGTGWHPLGRPEVEQKPALRGLHVAAQRGDLQPALDNTRGVLAAPFSPSPGEQPLEHLATIGLLGYGSSTSRSSELLNPQKLWARRESVCMLPDTQEAWPYGWSAAFHRNEPRRYRSRTGPTSQ